MEQGLYDNPFFVIGCIREVIRAKNRSLNKVRSVREILYRFDRAREEKTREEKNTAVQKFFDEAVQKIFDGGTSEKGK